MFPENTIHCIDAVAGLKQLDDDIIPMTLTSPAYGAMRTYGGHTWDFLATVQEGLSAPDSCTPEPQIFVPLYCHFFQVKWGQNRPNWTGFCHRNGPADLDVTPLPAI
jgi:hypothetical protein